MRSAFRALRDALFSPRSYAALAAPAVILASLHYTVRPGDTLGKIAAAHCGTASDWTGIYAASGLHGSPDMIYPGERLTLSCTQARLHVRLQAPVHVTTAIATRTASAGWQDPGGTLTTAQVERLWTEAGGPVWAESRAAEIAYCESGYRTGAYNPSGATGLWQILGAVVPGNLYDALTNARNAVAKFRASGNTFAQWVCKLGRGRCSYR